MQKGALNMMTIGLLRTSGNDMDIIWYY